MKIIAQMLGGSHSYGLNTSSSDIDVRGIFLNEDVSTIIGLGRHEHQLKQKDSEDSVMTEFRNALKLLRSSNTQMVEMLFNENWVSVSEEWNEVIKYRSQLIDSEKLFSSLRGYKSGELKLTLGIRTGKLGGKRYEQLQKFGYSPKNAVQCLRLMWAGKIYFSKNYFPVLISQEDKNLSDLLLDIKVNPQNYSIDFIKNEIEKYEQLMIQSFNNRKTSTFFNEDLANNLCFKTYYPLLENLKTK